MGNSCQSVAWRCALQSSIRREWTGEKRRRARKEHVHSSLCATYAERRGAPPLVRPKMHWYLLRYTKIVLQSGNKSKYGASSKLPPIYTGGCSNHRRLHEEEEITIEGGFLEEGVRSVEGPGRGRDHVHSSRVWVMGGPTVAEL